MAHPPVSFAEKRPVTPPISNCCNTAPSLFTRDGLDTQKSSSDVFHTLAYKEPPAIHVRPCPGGKETAQRVTGYTAMFPAPGIPSLVGSERSGERMCPYTLQPHQSDNLSPPLPVQDPLRTRYNARDHTAPARDRSLSYWHSVWSGGPKPNSGVSREDLPNMCNAKSSSTASSGASTFIHSTEAPEGTSTATSCPHLPAAGSSISATPVTSTSAHFAAAPSYLSAPGFAPVGVDLHQRVAATSVNRQQSVPTAYPPYIWSEQIPINRTRGSGATGLPRLAYESEVALIHFAVYLVCAVGCVCVYYNYVVLEAYVLALFWAVIFSIPLRTAMNALKRLIILTSDQQQTAQQQQQHRSSQRSQRQQQQLPQQQQQITNTRSPSMRRAVRMRRISGNETFIPSGLCSSSSTDGAEAKKEELQQEAPPAADADEQHGRTGIQAAAPAATAGAETPSHHEEEHKNNRAQPKQQENEIQHAQEDKERDEEENVMKQKEPAKESKQQEKVKRETLTAPPPLSLNAMYLHSPPRLAASKSSALTGECHTGTPPPESVRSATESFVHPEVYRHRASEPLVLRVLSRLLPSVAPTAAAAESLLAQENLLIAEKLEEVSDAAVRTLEQAHQQKQQDTSTTETEKTTPVEDSSGTSNSSSQSSSSSASGVGLIEPVVHAVSSAFGKGLEEKSNAEKEMPDRQKHERKGHTAVEVKNTISQETLPVVHSAAGDKEGVKQYTGTSFSPREVAVPAGEEDGQRRRSPAFSEAAIPMQAAEASLAVPSIDFHGERAATCARTASVLDVAVPAANAASSSVSREGIAVDTAAAAESDVYISTEEAVGASAAAPAAAGASAENRLSFSGAGASSDKTGTADFAVPAPSARQHTEVEKETDVESKDQRKPLTCSGLLTGQACLDYAPDGAEHEKSGEKAAKTTAAADSHEETLQQGSIPVILSPLPADSTGAAVPLIGGFSSSSSSTPSSSAVHDGCYSSSHVPAEHVPQESGGQVMPVQGAAAATATAALTDTPGSALTATAPPAAAALTDTAAAVATMTDTTPAVAASTEAAGASSEAAAGGGLYASPTRFDKNRVLETVGRGSEEEIEAAKEKAGEKGEIACDERPVEKQQEKQQVHGHEHADDADGKMNGSATNRGDIHIRGSYNSMTIGRDSVHTTGRSGRVNEEPSATLLMSVTSSCAERRGVKLQERSTDRLEERDTDIQTLAQKAGSGDKWKNGACAGEKEGGGGKARAPAEGRSGVGDATAGLFGVGDDRKERRDEGGREDKLEETGNGKEGDKKIKEDALTSVEEGLRMAPLQQSSGVAPQTRAEAAAAGSSHLLAACTGDIGSNEEGNKTACTSITGAAWTATSNQQKATVLDTVGVAHVCEQKETAEAQQRKTSAGVNEGVEEAGAQERFFFRRSQSFAPMHRRNFDLYRLYCYRDTLCGVTGAAGPTSVTRENHRRAAAAAFGGTSSSCQRIKKLSGGDSIKGGGGAGLTAAGGWRSEAAADMTLGDRHGRARHDEKNRDLSGSFFHKGCHIFSPVRRLFPFSRHSPLSASSSVARVSPAAAAAAAAHACPSSTMTPASSPTAQRPGRRPPSWALLADVLLTSWLVRLPARFLLFFLSPLLSLVSPTSRAQRRYASRPWFSLLYRCCLLLLVSRLVSSFTEHSLSSLLLCAAAVGLAALSARFLLLVTGKEDVVHRSLSWLSPPSFLLKLLGRLLQPLRGSLQTSLNPLLAILVMVTAALIVSLIFAFFCFQFYIELALLWDSFQRIIDTYILRSATLQQTMVAIHNFLQPEAGNAVHQQQQGSLTAATAAGRGAGGGGEAAEIGPMGGGGGLDSSLTSFPSATGVSVSNSAPFSLRNSAAAAAAAQVSPSASALLLSLATKAAHAAATSTQAAPRTARAAQAAGRGQQYQHHERQAGVSLDDIEAAAVPADASAEDEAHRHRSVHPAIVTGRPHAEHRDSVGSKAEKERISPQRGEENENTDNEVREKNRGTVSRATESAVRHSISQTPPRTDMMQREPIGIRSLVVAALEALARAAAAEGAAGSHIEEGGPSNTSEADRVSVATAVRGRDSTSNRVLPPPLSQLRQLFGGSVGRYMDLWLSIKHIASVVPASTSSSSSSSSSAGSPLTPSTASTGGASADNISSHSNTQLFAATTLNYPSHVSSYNRGADNNDSSSVNDERTAPRTIPAEKQQHATGEDVGRVQPRQQEQQLLRQTSMDGLVLRHKKNNSEKHPLSDDTITRNKKTPRMKKIRNDRCERCSLKCRGNTAPAVDISSDTSDVVSKLSSLATKPQQQQQQQTPRKSVAVVSQHHESPHTDCCISNTVISGRNSSRWASLLHMLGWHTYEEEGGPTINTTAMSLSGACDCSHTSGITTGAGEAETAAEGASESCASTSILQWDKGGLQRQQQQRGMTMNRPLASIAGNEHLRACVSSDTCDTWGDSEAAAVEDTVTKGLCDHAAAAGIEWVARRTQQDDKQQQKQKQKQKRYISKQRSGWESSTPLTAVERHVSHEPGSKGNSSRVTYYDTVAADGKERMKEQQQARRDNTRNRNEEEAVNRDRTIVGREKEEEGGLKVHGKKKCVARGLALQKTTPHTDISLRGKLSHACDSALDATLLEEVFGRQGEGEENIDQEVQGRAKNCVSGQNCLQASRHAGQTCPSATAIAAAAAASMTESVGAFDKQGNAGATGGVLKAEQTVATEDVVDANKDKERDKDRCLGGSNNVVVGTTSCVYTDNDVLLKCLQSNDIPPCLPVETADTEGRKSRGEDDRNCAADKRRAGGSTESSDTTGARSHAENAEKERVEKLHVDEKKQERGRRREAAVCERDAGEEVRGLCQALRHKRRTQETMGKAMGTETQERKVPSMVESNADTLAKEEGTLCNVAAERAESHIEPEEEVGEEREEVEIRRRSKRRRRRELSGVGIEQIDQSTYTREAASESRTAEAGGIINKTLSSSGPPYVSLSARTNDGSPDVWASCPEHAEATGEEVCASPSTITAALSIEGNAEVSGADIEEAGVTPERDRKITHFHGALAEMERDNYMSQKAHYTTKEAEDHRAKEEDEDEDDVAASEEYEGNEAPAAIKGASTLDATNGGRDVSVPIKGDGRETHEAPNDATAEGPKSEEASPSTSSSFDLLKRWENTAKFIEQLRRGNFFGAATKAKEAWGEIYSLTSEGWWSYVTTYANTLFSGLVNSGFGALRVCFFVFLLAFRFFLSAFDMLLQAVVFFSALYYLLCSSRSCLEYLEELLCIVDPSCIISHSINRGLRAILVSSVKRVWFYSLFTWLVYESANMPVVYVPTAVSGLLALLPLLPPETISILPCIILWWGGGGGGEGEVSEAGKGQAEQLLLLQQQGQHQHQQQQQYNIGTGLGGEAAARKRDGGTSSNSNATLIGGVMPPVLADFTMLQQPIYSSALGSTAAMGNKKEGRDDGQQTDGCGGGGSSTWWWLLLDSFLLRSSQRKLGALVLLAANAGVWWNVTTAIYREIPDSNPWLVGLSVALGLSTFGLKGIIIGPVLATIPLIVLTAAAKFSERRAREHQQLALSSGASASLIPSPLPTAVRTRPSAAAPTVGPLCFPPLSGAAAASSKGVHFSADQSSTPLLPPEYFYTQQQQQEQDVLTAHTRGAFSAAAAAVAPDGASAAPTPAPIGDNTLPSHGSQHPPRTLHGTDALSSRERTIVAAGCRDVTKMSVGGGQKQLHIHTDTHPARAIAAAAEGGSLQREDAEKEATAEYYLQKSTASPIHRCGRHSHSYSPTLQRRQHRLQYYQRPQQQQQQQQWSHEQQLPVHSPWDAYYGGASPFQWQEKKDEELAQEEQIHSDAGILSGQKMMPVRLARDASYPLVRHVHAAGSGVVTPYPSSTGAAATSKKHVYETARRVTEPVAAGATQKEEETSYVHMMNPQRLHATEASEKRYQLYTGAESPGELQQRHTAVITETEIRSPSRGNLFVGDTVAPPGPVQALELHNAGGATEASAPEAAAVAARGTATAAAGDDASYPAAKTAEEATGASVENREALSEIKELAARNPPAAAAAAAAAAVAATPVPLPGINTSKLPERGPLTGPPATAEAAEAAQHLAAAVEAAAGVKAAAIAEALQASTGAGDPVQRDPNSLTEQQQQQNDNGLSPVLLLPPPSQTWVEQSQQECLCEFEQRQKLRVEEDVSQQRDQQTVPLRVTDISSYESIGSRPVDAGASVETEDIPEDTSFSFGLQPLQAGHQQQQQQQQQLERQQEGDRRRKQPEDATLGQLSARLALHEPEQTIPRQPIEEQHQRCPLCLSHSSWVTGVGCRAGCNFQSKGGTHVAATNAVGPYSSSSRTAVVGPSSIHTAVVDRYSPYFSTAVIGSSPSFDTAVVGPSLSSNTAVVGPSLSSNTEAVGPVPPFASSTSSDSLASHTCAAAGMHHPMADAGHIHLPVSSRIAAAAASPDAVPYHAISHQTPSDHLSCPATSSPPVAAVRTSHLHPAAGTIAGVSQHPVAAGNAADKAYHFPAAPDMISIDTAISSCDAAASVGGAPSRHTYFAYRQFQQRSEEEIQQTHFGGGAQAKIERGRLKREATTSMASGGATCSDSGTLPVAVLTRDSRRNSSSIQTLRSDEREKNSLETPSQRNTSRWREMQRPGSSELVVLRSWGTTEEGYGIHDEHVNREQFARNTGGSHDHNRLCGGKVDCEHRCICETSSSIPLRSSCQARSSKSSSSGSEGSDHMDSVHKKVPPFFIKRHIRSSSSSSEVFKREKTPKRGSSIGRTAGLENVTYHSRPHAAISSPRANPCVVVPQCAEGIEAASGHAEEETYRIGKETESAAYRRQERDAYAAVTADARKLTPSTRDCVHIREYGRPCSASARETRSLPSQTRSTKNVYVGCSPNRPLERRSFPPKESQQLKDDSQQQRERVQDSMLHRWGDTQVVAADKWCAARWASVRASDVGEPQFKEEYAVSVDRWSPHIRGIKDREEYAVSEDGRPPWIDKDSGGETEWWERRYTATHRGRVGKMLEWSQERGAVKTTGTSTEEKAIAAAHTHWRDDVVPPVGLCDQLRYSLDGSSRRCKRTREERPRRDTDFSYPYEAVYPGIQERPEVQTQHPLCVVPSSAGPRYFFTSPAAAITGQHCVTPLLSFDAAAAGAPAAVYYGSRTVAAATAGGPSHTETSGVHVRGVIISGRGVGGSDFGPVRESSTTLHGDSGSVLLQPLLQRMLAASSRWNDKNSSNKGEETSAFAASAGTSLTQMHRSAAAAAKHRIPSSTTSSTQHYDEKPSASSRSSSGAVVTNKQHQDGTRTLRKEEDDDEEEDPQETENVEEEEHEHTHSSMLAAAVRNTAETLQWLLERPARTTAATTSTTGHAGVYPGTPTGATVTALATAKAPGHSLGGLPAESTATATDTSGKKASCAPNEGKGGGKGREKTTGVPAARGVRVKTSKEGSARGIKRVTHIKRKAAGAAAQSASHTTTPPGELIRGGEGCDNESSAASVLAATISKEGPAAVGDKITVKRATKEEAGAASAAPQTATSLATPNIEPDISCDISWVRSPLSTGARNEAEEGAAAKGEQPARRGVCAGMSSQGPSRSSSTRQMAGKNVEKKGSRGRGVPVQRQHLLQQQRPQLWQRRRTAQQQPQGHMTKSASRRDIAPAATETPGGGDDGKEEEVLQQ